MKFEHCMLDIETLASTYDAIVVSVGAVRFNMLEEEYETFYKVFYDAIDQIDVGRVWSMETVEWWHTQPLHISHVGLYPDRFKGYIDGASTEEGLTLLNKFIGNNYVWGNGVTFDNVIIRDIMNNYDIKPKWGFRKDMCYRTVKNIYSHITPEEDNTSPHNALADAIYQMKHLKKIFKERIL